MKKTLVRCLSAALYLSLACFTHATPSADVKNYAVMKGQAFLQTSANSPVLASNSLPYIGRVLIHPATSTSVTSVTVLSPAGKVKTLTNFTDSFEYSQVYTNKGALDGALPTGVYTFTMETMNNGEQKPKVTLAADAYPVAAPHVSNWADTQNIDAALPLTITWDAFTGGTTNDYISVKIVDGSDTTIFQTPGLLNDGALDGTDLQSVVPAGTLSASQSYTARLQFSKRTGLFTTNYSGASGFAGYYKQTSYTINTLAAAPSAGRVQFASSLFSVDENNGPANITVVRSDTNGAVTVNFVTTDGTATSGLDYTGYNTTITLDDGVASTNFALPIIDDSILEGNETVHLTISSPTGGAVLGSLSNAVLVIVDNEKAASGVLQF